MRQLQGLVVTFVVVLITTAMSLPLHTHGDHADGSRQHRPSQNDEDVSQLQKLKAEGRETTLPFLQRQLEAESHQDGEIAEPRALPVGLDIGLQGEIPSIPEEVQLELKAHEKNGEIATTASEPPTEAPTEPPIKAFPGAARLMPGTSTLEVAPSAPEEQEQPANHDMHEVSNTEITENGNRRNAPPSKNDVNGLQWYSGGQYSPLDMAQYVFWTGDESGVARAVQEFIQNGLMSREEAITFLRDIRIGIEYLQNRYDNLLSPNNLKEVSDNIPISTTPRHTVPSIPAIKSTIAPHHEPVQATKSVQKVELPVKKELTLKTVAEKKLVPQTPKVEHERVTDPAGDYDEVAGRVRLSNFLYTEYSLEEVIYQLAKVMFAESLRHDSGGHAGGALERLTGFLNQEGNSGRISRTFQKKILDVLLAALSDALIEHPELLEAAREGIHTPVKLNTKVRFG